MNNLNRKFINLPLNANQINTRYDETHRTWAESSFARVAEQWKQFQMQISTRLYFIQQRWIFSCNFAKLECYPMVVCMCLCVRVCIWALICVCVCVYMAQRGAHDWPSCCRFCMIDVWFGWKYWAQTSSLNVTQWNFSIDDETETIVIIVLRYRQLIQGSIPYTTKALRIVVSDSLTFVNQVSDSVLIIRVRLLALAE